MSEIPEISLIRTSTNTFVQGSEDSVYIFFRLRDGDANIDGDSTRIFISDVRADSVNLAFEMAFPDVPADLQDKGRGIDATCTIAFDKSYFYLREDDPDRISDTMHLELYIKDEALNRSNTIKTEDIIITLP